MPEAEPNEADATEPQEPAEAGRDDQPDDKPLGENGEKALKSERTRAENAEKQMKALQARLDEIDQANLSELEKAQKQAQDASTRLAELERTNLLQRVALAKGVPADLVGRLRGDTEEELSADADTLLALLNAPKTPAPDDSAGAKGTSPQSGDWLRAKLTRT